MVMYNFLFSEVLGTQNQTNPRITLEPERKTDFGIDFEGNEAFVWSDSAKKLYSLKAPKTGFFLSIDSLISIDQQLRILLVRTTYVVGFASPRFTMAHETSGPFKGSIVFFKASNSWEGNFLSSKSLLTFFRI